MPLFKGFFIREFSWRSEKTISNCDYQIIIIEMVCPPYYKQNDLSKKAGLPLKYSKDFLTVITT